MASLSPLDLLSLSSVEQQILRCLTKYPRCTPQDIADRTALPLDEVENELQQLLEQARVVEQLQQGERVFSIRFQFKHKRVRNMPGEILDLLNQSPKNFLAETSLTHDLDVDAIEDLFSLSQERTLFPNEVFAWQGQALKFVAVVQQGLLSSTRLNGNHSGQQRNYLHQGSWLGLPEALNESVLTVTYTAVTESTLLVWPVVDLIAFVEQKSVFATAIARQLSQQLRQCEKSQTQGRSKLWVIDGVHAGAGVTTLATNLAMLAQQQTEKGQSSRTLFWPAVEVPELSWFLANEKQHQKSVGLAQIATLSNGLDVLVSIESNSFSSQVQLDVLLADLMARYETIICDAGCDTENELLLRLHGRAQIVLTLTQDNEGADAGIARWNHLQSYSFPGQNRILALNGSDLSVTEVNPRFHLLIPDDAEGLSQAEAHQQSLVVYLPDSGVSQAFQEVYRRLSLNHTVALFVPSTMDVDQQTDNSSQVQETLSFLGHLFGGATSSNAEGAWRSEDTSLVTEQVTIVRTFVSKKSLDKHLDDVFDFASGLKRDMKQEAVAISVDNQLILV